MRPISQSTQSDSPYLVPTHPEAHCLLGTLNIPHHQHHAELLTGPPNRFSSVQTHALIGSRKKLPVLRKCAITPRSNIPMSSTRRTHPRRKRLSLHGSQPTSKSRSTTALLNLAEAPTAPLSCPLVTPLPAAPPPTPSLLWSSTITLCQSLLQPTYFAPATSLSTSFPAFSACTSFSDIIATSIAQANPGTTDTALIEAARCFTAGEQLDLQRVADHNKAATSDFLTVISSLSTQLLHRTLQPTFADLPSLNLPSLPVLPSSDVSLSTSPSVSSLTFHAQAVPSSQLDVTDVKVVSTVYYPRTQLLPSVLDATPSFDLTNFDPGIATLPRHERLNLLATQGGPIVLPHTFKPNGGIGVHGLPFAPQPAIALHCIRLHNEGRGIILPLADAQRICHDQALPLHVSTPFLAAKPDAPLGRLVSDYSNSRGCPINCPTKKPILSTLWAPIINPTAADICQAYSNAVSSFPEEDIYGLRIDISDAFPRIRIRPADVTLLALYFTHEGKDMVFFPLTNQFGCQDSNYQWQPVIDYILHHSILRDQSSFNCSHTAAFVDDIMSFGSLPHLSAKATNITADASIVGAHAIKASKTLLQQDIALVGYQLNCILGTIGLTEKIFCRLLNQLFNVIPTNINVGDCIPLHTLQTLASYALRCSQVIPLLKPFSRGFSFNTRGFLHPNASVPLNTRTIADIWMWRTVLFLSTTNPQILRIPTTYPLLLRLLPGETDDTRAHRQASHATVVGYADACTTNAGLGGFIPDIGWFTSAIPSLLTYTQLDGTIVPTDINILEFLAAIITAFFAILSLPAYPSQSSTRHVHIWTDNTSCRSWLTKYSAIHPLHCCLLQVYAFLQVKYDCLITTGKIPGKVNTFADAASRAFNCPNGPELKRQLSYLQQLPSLPIFLEHMVSVAQQPFKIISSQLVASLTALDIITSSGFASSTTLPTHR